MALDNPKAWGKLRKRYETPGPRHMLALDGGGIRGLLTLQVLLEIEKKLRKHYGDPQLRLCQYFDYISGTSTGAIIATALARGMAVNDVIEFYREFAQEVFSRRFRVWKSLYQNGPLEKKLKQVFGVRSTLHPKHLQTLLLVVTRNATTDSIPLWRLVRASTAAPIYFPPEVIEWDEDDPSKSFVFVDGGTTSYNNPAFCMYRMATEPAYRLGWERGERNLLVVSLGTGSAPNLGADAEDPESNLASSAVNTLVSLMNQAAFDQDVNARTAGRCTTGPGIDSEIGTLVPQDADGRPIPLEQDLGRSFLYARYDATLTPAWLKSRGLGRIDAARVAKLDSVDSVADLERVGKAVAKDVDLRHLGRFLDDPVHELS
jgi:hypothetical protein